ncbi:MAG: lantibiotic dehydratase C-terminal domain-containing protein [Thermoanaerobaculia bacterium]
MSQESWISGHLHYHQSFYAVVRGFVHPLVVSLAEEGLIDAFFFIRYGLGGPHVRLRLRVLPGAGEGALEAMQESARRFLQAEPSTASWSEEMILRTNELYLVGDPSQENAAYPDNFLRVVPFQPEVERYGGPDLFQPSLDLFTPSSVAAVEFLFRYADAPRSVQLARAFQLLLLQARGSAIDEAELADLLRYGVDSMGADMPKIVEKADAVARSQMDAFLRLFHEDQSSPASDLLALGARRLSHVAGSAGRAYRARIGGSQLHMTANRLGLANAEEVYLSRLLTATLEEARLHGGPGEIGPRDPEPLAALLPRALSLLAGLPD